MPSRVACHQQSAGTWELKGFRASFMQAGRKGTWLPLCSPGISEESGAGGRGRQGGSRSGKQALLHPPGVSHGPCHWSSTGHSPPGPSLGRFCSAGTEVPGATSPRVALQAGRLRRAADHVCRAHVRVQETSREAQGTSAPELPRLE